MRQAHHQRQLTIGRQTVTLVGTQIFGFAKNRVGRQEVLPGVEKAEENRKLGAPGEQVENELAAGSKDLCWHEDDALYERPKLHAQHALAIKLVSGAPPRSNGDRQGEPCLERPRDRDDHHVGPVGVEGIERSTECADAALELGEEILLIASTIRLTDDLLAGLCGRW